MKSRNNVSLGGSLLIVATAMIASPFSYAARPLASAPVVAASLPADCYVGAGCLDNSFGNSGKLIQLVGSGGNAQSANAIVVQPDGKIVAAGRGKLPNGDWGFTVLRFETNGTLDPLFGNSGQVQVATTAALDLEDAQAVALQADGSILVSGFVSSSGKVIRLDSWGNLDLSFGSSGIATVNFQASSRKIGIQADGKIVIGGGSGPRFYAARLNTDGSIDSSFGSAGYASVLWGKTSSPAAKANSLVIQNDGKIVLAGEGTPGRNSDFAVARFLSSGSLDSSFGSGGKVSLDFFAKADAIFGVALDSSNNIVVAGRAQTGTSATSYNLAAARITPSGSIDSSFGSSGKVSIDVNGGRDEGYSVAISNSKIVLLGITALPDESDSHFVVSRLNANGSLDSSFGTSGLTQTDFDGKDRGVAMDIQSDGNIVACGMAGSGISGWALARYLQ